MQVTVNGQKIELRRISDEEFDAAQELAGSMSRSLNRCPTCRTSRSERTDNPDLVPTYRLNGIEHPCDCQSQETLYRHYLVAGIPDQYMRLNWEDYAGSPQARKNVEDYLNNWESFFQHGFGFEFGGPAMGIGKTWCATHMGKELVKRGQKVFFTPFVEMVSAFEKENGVGLEKKIRNTPFVILDDIMPPRSERQANFYHTRFEAIIRHRTNYNLPTIITTNLTEDELNSYYPRTYSLLSAKQVRVDMDGDDARRHKIGEEELTLSLMNEVKPIT